MANEIVLQKGDSADFLVTIKKNNENQDPKDLTGLKVIMTVRLNLTDDNPVIQKLNTAAGGDDTQIEMVDPVGGQCRIYFTPIDTEALRFQGEKYKYDIQISNVSGTYVKTPIRSTITLKDDVTR